MAKKCNAVNKSGKHKIARIIAAGWSPTKRKLAKERLKAERQLLADIRNLNSQEAQS